MIRLSAFADEAGDSLAEQIAALNGNGIAFIDVRNVDGVNVSAFSDKQIKEYAEAFGNEGIRVSCIGSPFGKRAACTFREVESEFYRLLDIADGFGSKKIRVFSFYEYAGKENTIFDCLAEAVSKAKEREITLYHENELGIFGETPERCLELIEKTGIGCLYDPANFVLSGINAENAEKAIMPHCDFVHVKDARYTGEIVPAGYGDGRIDGVIRDGFTLTVEPHLHSFGGYGSLTGRVLKGTSFAYSSPREAFDAGVMAVREIIRKNGLAEERRTK